MKPVISMLKFPVCWINELHLVSQFLILLKFLINPCFFACPSVLFTHEMSVRKQYNLLTVIACRKESPTFGTLLLKSFTIMFTFWKHHTVEL